MARTQYLVLLLFCLAIVANGMDSIAKNPKALRNWFKTRARAQMKLTELHFYVQDDLSSKTPTNQVVATANSTSTSPTLFGLMAVIDDPIRKEPRLDSEIVGRAQGFFAFASLEEMKLHMTFDLVFTSGSYNGSTLSFVGHNPYKNKNRELPIVGGSGVFRLARGAVIINTVTFNSSTGDALFDYHVFVLHYA